MAQPLERRISSALHESSRLADVEALSAEVEKEITETGERHESEVARSIDPALTTPQAREARDNSADLEHDLRRLNASLDMLRARRQKILDDESYARRRERYAAAKRERDEVACLIRTRYPALAAELASMAECIFKSDAECAAANADRPRGEPLLVSAEQLARDCGLTWPGGGPVLRIGEMHVPLLHGVGQYLPLPEQGGTVAKLWREQIKADAAFAQRAILETEKLEKSDA